MPMPRAGICCEMEPSYFGFQPAFPALGRYGPTKHGSLREVDDMVDLTNRELEAAIRVLDGYKPTWGEDRNDAIYSAAAKLRMEFHIRLTEAARVMP